MKLRLWWRKRDVVVPFPPQPVKPMNPIAPLRPKDPNYVVTETEMTQTGMFRIFPWLKKKDEKSGGGE